MNRDKLLEKIKEFIDRQPEKKFIPGETYISPHGAVVDGNDVQAICDVALSGWLTEGKWSNLFEKDLRHFYKETIRNVTLTNSGSSANLLAVTTITDKVFGRRRAEAGDEIITVAAGFPTTFNPILQNNLVPVIVDVDLETWTPDVEVIENAIVEGKTKGIVLAHPLGNPFDAETIRDICNEYGIWMVEDSCDSLGSTLNDSFIGSFGDVATLSFYPAHHITAGEGGACLTQSPMVKKVLESYRDWGRDCFPAGTKVEANGKIISIENVKIGDYVLSHTGQLRRVEKLTGKLDDSFVSIKPRLMKEITATSNHPFYVQKSVLHWPSDRDWTFARDIKVGDYVLESIPQEMVSSPVQFSYSYDTEYQTKEETIPIEPGLMRLIGYWLAEGSVSSGFKGKSGYKENKYKYYRVDFSFNMNEEETMDDVCNLMFKYFGVVGNIRQIRNSRGASLTFKTRKGYEFFSQFFGTLSYEKSLPFNMIQWNKSLGLDELIKGFWIGDGGSSKQGFSLCSVSETLINQLRRLLLRYKVVGSFHERSHHKTSVVNGKVISAKHILHSINFYGCNAEEFGKLIGQEFKSKTNEQKVYFDEEYVYYPVESVKVFSTDHAVKVYNFEVEIDNSYHVEGLAVHNCWCETGMSNTCGLRFAHQLGELPEGYDHKYTYSRIGYNLKSTDMSAGLLVSQLKKLPDFIEKRRENWNKLYIGLEKFGKYFRFQKSIKGANPSWFGFAITVKETAPFSRKEFINYLEEHKIGTRLFFGGNLLRHPAYIGVPVKIFQEPTNSDILCRDALWIGCHPSMTDEMIDYIITTISTFIEENRR